MGRGVAHMSDHYGGKENNEGLVSEHTGVQESQVMDNALRVYHNSDNFGTACVVACNELGSPAAGVHLTTARGKNIFSHLGTSWVKRVLIFF